MRSIIVGATVLATIAGSLKSLQKTALRDFPWTDRPKIIKVIMKTTRDKTPTPAAQDRAEQPDLPANGFLRRSILIPMMALLRQGITPEKMALCIALGIILGVTPLLGFSSVLCFAAAVLLHLNAPAIQLVNYLVYPLQFILLIPFIRIGEWLFAARPMHLSVARILSLIRQDAWVAVGTLWTATMHAVVAWIALGSLAVLLFYLLLVPTLRRLARSMYAGDTI